MKERKLHMIGYAHSDPVWLWQWQEGFQEMKATFRSALDRMNEYEPFIFTSSQAAMYEWLEEHDAGMFKEIRARVAEGRWVLCGGWWVQADCNLPSGESFIRQGLYGQRYFQEKFGTLCTVGYNTDSFGHHAMLPQLLKGCGMDAYVFMRPGSHERQLASDLFRWTSPDGSSVLTYRIPFYTHIITGTVEQGIRFGERQTAESPWKTAMIYYGVGNHGGGPTKQNIETVMKEAELSGAGPVDIVFSSPDRFFEDMRTLPDIPVLAGELQMHAKGCYSVQAATKKWNRQAEQLMATTEKWASVSAMLLGRPYPELDRAWKNVLFNQFHDILPGSSISAALDRDARDAYGESHAIAGRALNDALQSISWRIHIDPEEGMKPIVVFNAHAWPVKANVELDFGHFGEGREFHSFTDQDTLVDERGQEVAVQRVTPLSTTIWRQRLSFVAELPALGYRTFRVVRRSSLTSAADFEGIDATDTRLENAYLRLELDPATGGIRSLYDKRSGAELFAVGGIGGGIAAVIEDRSDTWSHGIERFDRQIGVFRPTSIRLLELGPVKSVIRVASEYGASRLLQDFTMYRELDGVEVKSKVDWLEQFKLLKLRFEVAVDADGDDYEIPYGVITRPNDGLEYPGQSWFSRTGMLPGQQAKAYGISILNDCNYSFDTKGNTMSMTVLRSPIVAYDENAVLDHRHQDEYDYTDQGRHHFAYTLLPHHGSWREGDTIRRAAELNQPPITVIETYHDGPLPQQGSFISVDGEGVQADVLKRAEDGDGWIIRCRETAGRANAHAVVSLPILGRTVDALLGPYEIKTFRIPTQPELPVVETDFLERPSSGT
ncbi:alpha-mannosidase [Paenibacillus sacheonensis]|uniref:Alpha-mannosidase n=1 Tax=Paenibacillus sacheonensis TaxID=742054 RepID=A0A7X4YL72_9BACL|nr:alpha-mannosidase [Paenibacillus sacheonensis]MBM7564253.1 alpha-mannosidase [Paenibacillus sacheonensis]NBC67424.1 alpha-mannosidase [Paenibacillus sacheonensis]